jgi:hypothetical protein
VESETNAHTGVDCARANHKSAGHRLLPPKAT